MSDPLSGPRLCHQFAPYDGDRAYLDFAVPFCEEGLKLGEPVLVITTPANLDLLGQALGDQGRRLDHAESAYLGRRAHDRAAALVRYQRRHEGAKRFRVLAEPLWAGRTLTETVAWHRLEAGLNLLLDGSDLWMLCPYDTRVADADVLATAVATHPFGTVEGSAEPTPNERSTDPATFIELCDAAPLPSPPPGTPAAVVTSLSALREYVTERAGELGLGGERAGLLTVAANEVAAYLAAGDMFASDVAPLTVRLWSCFRGTLCEIWQRGAREIDPMAGFRPPGPRPAADDGLWLARQLSESLDVRCLDDACVMRLQVPDARAEEVKVYSGHKGG